MQKKLNQNKIINLISDYLEERTEILFAYLFGSFLKTEVYHDIDIAIFVKDDFPVNDLQKFPFGYQSMITGYLSKLLKSENIDLVLLNNAPLLITNRIINQGQLLFEKDRFKRVSFENYNRKLFIDTENFRKIKTYYLKKKINQNA